MVIITPARAPLRFCAPGAIRGDIACALGLPVRYVHDVRLKSNGRVARKSNGRVARKVEVKG